MRALILIGLVACGGSPGPGGSGGGSGGSSGAAGGNGSGGGIGAQLDRQALSGTRLKVRYVAGEDGSRQFAGFRDTMRNENCTFALAEDGMTRCLPFDSSLTALQEIVYEDSTCNQPAAVLDRRCQTPKYAVFTLFDRCPASYEFFPVAMEVTPPMLYRKNPAGTACSQVMIGTLPSSQGVFRLNAKVAPSAFVAGSIQTE